MRMAKSAPAMASWMKRPIFFSSFFAIQRSGSKPWTSAAMRQSNAVASKWVMGPMPLCAGENFLPDLVGADAQGTDQADTRYHDSAPQRANSPLMDSGERDYFLA